MESLTIFIAVTAAAVVLQAAILVAMYLAVRQTSARVEALAADVKSKVLPTVESANSMLTELRPKIENVITNVSDTSNKVRAQVERLDATVGDAIDRGRLQIIRADELLTRTMDKVENATEVVHKTVVSPVRQFSGLMHGLSAGFETFFGKQRRRNGSPAQDEMFI